MKNTTNLHMNSTSDLNWANSVRQFKELIENDSMLRMNWENGIQLSTNLKDKTAQDVYNMIDQIIKEPPEYKNCIFIGFPLNFIFLDLMQNQSGRAFFTNDKVNVALKNILNDYAKMLESPQSIKYMNKTEGTGWFSKEADEQINNWQFKCNPQLDNYGYKCWNDWFVREFKEGMRPVGDGAPPDIDASNMIVNACESVPLDNPQQPQRNCKLVDKFWLKSNRYSLSDIFGGKKHKRQHIAKHFEGGTVYQAYLNALSYHRWHTPVDGTIQDIYQIDANYYFDQSQFIDYDPSTQTGCQSFLTAIATRKIFIINSDNEKIGKVALVCVGMAEVSCCVSIVSIGSRVKKGDQLGFFKFGGSSHAIIFEKKAKLKFKVEGDEPDGTKFTLQKVNSYLAHIE